MIEFVLTRQMLEAAGPTNEEAFLKSMFWANFRLVREKPEFHKCDTIKVMIVPQIPIPRYEDRKENLDAATENLFKIVQALPGMTAKELAREYPTRFRHSLSTYDNKLRKLRADGRVRSEAGSDGLLRWYPI